MREALPELQQQLSRHNRLRFHIQGKVITGSRRLTLSLGLVSFYTHKSVSFLVQVSPPGALCVYNNGGRRREGCWENEQISEIILRIRGSTKVGIQSWEVVSNFLPFAFALIPNATYQCQYPALWHCPRVLQDITPGETRERVPDHSVLFPATACQSISMKSPANPSTPTVSRFTSWNAKSNCS